MNDIKEKNEKLLQKNFSQNELEIYKRLWETEIINCSIAICENQEKIVCVNQNNRVWRLNSIYDPDRAAKVYAMRYDTIRDFAVICIFGLSDGRIVRELIKKCNGTQEIVIYEPNVEVFLMAMKEFPLDDILRSERVHLIVNQINEMTIDKKMEKLVTYHNRELIMHCILPNYDILYRKQCEAQIEKMLYFSHAEIYKKNTEVLFGVKFADNILSNMSHILNGSSLHDLKQTIRKLNLSGVPAIIVSAGPSLDKNIKQLKKAEGKAFIIGVDSALKALTREGINFQMAISVDPRKNPDVFNDDKVNAFPYVLATYAIPIIAERNTNHLFFMDGYGFNTFKNIFLEQTGKKFDTLNTGGSVATEALSMAIDFGFSKVILVGQDLAFTGGKGHVSGFEKSEAADKAHVESRSLTEVEAIDGGMVMTDVQMDSYRKWFEMQIAENKERIEFYNATEGGAKIHGATPLTLEEAIECFCTTEIDFDKIIADVPPAFSEHEKEKLLTVLGAAPDYLLEVAQKLEEGVDAYRRLVELEKNGMSKGSEYRIVLEKIAKVNKIEHEEPYMSIIKLYAKEAEYDAAGDIYAAEELSVEEIAERGIRLLQGYIESCETAKKRMELLMLPHLKEIK